MPRDIEMQHGSSWECCKDGKPPEETHAAIAAFCEPAGFPIYQRDDDGPKEVKNADDVVERAEEGT